MAKPKRSRVPKVRKGQEDDDDSDAHAAVPSSRDTSSQYYLDNVDKFHDDRTASLLAAGVQLQSDDAMSDDDEVMALDTDEDESDSAASDLEEDLPRELPIGLKKKLSRGKESKHKEDDADERESMESDLDERPHDEMPSELAWGQKKKLYYDTDYVGRDRKKKGVSQEDEDAEAEEEAAEAHRIQKRLAGHLDEDDYGLDFLQAFPQKEKPVGQKIEKNLKKISEKEKLKMLKKESPELMELLEDLKAKLGELEKDLKPLVQMVKKGLIQPGTGSHYIQTKYQLYLNYCTNISFYLVLRAKRIPVQGHPVIERLVSYRSLINDLGVVDHRLSSEMDLLLNRVVNKDTVANVSNSANLLQKKKHKPSKKTAPKVTVTDQPDNSDLDDEAALQYYNDMEKIMKRKRNKVDSLSEEDEAEADNLVPDAKRAITYQIAKNKGLTPKRKKIDRNPRVKHREKFRRAKIRRKGQVREVRKEERRYSGELSGIRAGIKKSIKLK